MNKCRPAGGMSAKVINLPITEKPDRLKQKQYQQSDPKALATAKKTHMLTKSTYEISIAVTRTQLTPTSHALSGARSETANRDARGGRSFK